MAALCSFCLDFIASLQDKTVSGFYMVHIIFYFSFPFSFSLIQKSNFEQVWWQYAQLCLKKNEKEKKNEEIILV